MSKWATRELGRPSSFIQWKGIIVCMDLYCPCGEQFHIDAEFTYAVQCPHCGNLFEMSSVPEVRYIGASEEWGGCAPVIGRK